jgi:hypothetical protein
VLSSLQFAWRIGAIGLEETGVLWPTSDGVRQRDAQRGRCSSQRVITIYTHTTIELRE